VKKKLTFAGELKAVSKEPTGDSILAVAGYASTKDVDRVNDIVEPSAFEGTMATYMKFPVILLNHSSKDTPVGKVTSYKIDENGLYIEASIVNTERGREVKALIEAGILKAFSIGFNIKKWEDSSDEGDPFRITELDLIEISIVSSPANIEALFEQAESKGITLKSITNPREGRGTKGPVVMEVQEVVDKSLAPLGDEIKTAQATIGDVKTEVGDIKKLVTTLQDAAKGHETSEAELKELVDRATADATKKLEALDAKVEEVKKQKPVEYAGGLPPTTDVKALVETKTPGQIKGIVGEKNAGDIIELQRKYDEVLWVDAFMCAASRRAQRDYHHRPIESRVKSLKIFQESFSPFAKAMYSTASGAGDEWVPTDLSTSLIEDIRLKGRVAPLFREFMMPTNPFDVPTQGSPTIATIVAESSGVPAAFDSTEQTPATGKVTFSAEKLRGRYYFSTELTEDSAIAIVPFAMDEIIYSLTRAKDQAIVNGQKTADIDTGYTIASTDAKKLVDGLRYAWLTTVNSGTAGDAAGVNLGTFTDDGLRTIRGEMGKYGEITSDLVWLLSIKGYLMRVLRDLSDYHTLEKFGNRAVVFSGQIDAIDSIPIVISEFIEETQDSAGVYSGSGYTRSSALLVHRPSFAIGIRRRDEVLSERVLSTDGYNIYAFHRMDFQPLRTPSSTNVTVNAGYNIDVAG